MGCRRGSGQTVTSMVSAPFVRRVGGGCVCKTRENGWFTRSSEALVLGERKGCFVWSCADCAAFSLKVFFFPTKNTSKLRGRWVTYTFIGSVRVRVFVLLGLQCL